MLINNAGNVNPVYAGYMPIGPISGTSSLNYPHE